MDADIGDDEASTSGGYSRLQFDTPARTGHAASDRRAFDVRRPPDPFQAAEEPAMPVSATKLSQKATAEDLSRLLDNMEWPEFQ